MRTSLRDEQRRPLVAAALREIRAACASVAALSAVTSMLMLTGPLFMMQIYDRVLASRSVPTLVALSALVIGLYIFLGFLELIRSRILTRIGQRLDERLGGPTFDAVLVLPLRISAREAASQPIRDLEQLRQFMSGPGPIAICDMPWLPLFLVFLFLLHPWFAILAAVGALILFALTLGSERILQAPMRRLAQLAAARAEFLEAGRRNAEALHAMGMREAYAARWHEANGRYGEEQRRGNDATNNFAIVSKVFRLALQSAVLAIGAWLAIRQLVSPGAMIAASILTSRALAPIEQAIGQWRGFVSARQAQDRLKQLLERIGTDVERMQLPQPEHSLAVAGLAVIAPGTQVPLIRDISFRLTAGQGLGVIGPSGSGKSTLARALVGIWPPLRGTVRLDMARIDQWDPRILGASLGYLPQDVELFDGTIAENISRFTTSTDAETVLAAARLAGAHELILSMPEGYDTRIGPGGCVLSAGQRQRIGLARALHGKPFLIVLDEPNANLDAEGESALTNAIFAVRERGSVVVVIAHRPSVLAAVDHVLVLAHGTQVGFGPRDEVLRKTTVQTLAEKAR